MKEIWKNIKVDDKKVRDFGILIFVIVGCIIPAIIAYKNGWIITELAQYLLAFSAAFLLLCLFVKMPMYRVYKAWMLLAIGLGFVMTRVITTLVYLLLMTPIGIFRRIKGNDVATSFFQFDKGGQDSYWIRRTDEYEKESTERQY